jgi:hypothetical protein
MKLTTEARGADASINWTPPSAGRLARVAAYHMAGTIIHKADRKSSNL